MSLLEREVIVLQEEMLEPAEMSESATDVFEAAKTEIFKRIVFALQLEAAGLHEVHDLRTRQKIDLYEEVEKFEKKLITQALLRTRGNQRAAAELLSLKATTLNSKIKLYNIRSVANVIA